MMADALKSSDDPTPMASLLQSNVQERRCRTEEGLSQYRQVSYRMEMESNPEEISKYTGLKKSNNHGVDRIRSIGEYRVKKTMDTGSTGSVKLAIHMGTGEEVAIKLVPRALLAEQSKRSRESLASKERRILREAAIHHLLRHPNIAHFHDFIITEEYYCVVMEYVDGGKLLDYITQHRQIKERQARKFFRQLISAVSYLHQNAIVHRDLKIENVLVDRRGNIKLIDFGLANFYDPNERLATYCGSLYFAAPELLHGRPYIGPEVDIWSLGIILYTMVCGSVPFDDKSLPALHEKIKVGRLQVPSHVSDECRHLLHRMICVDPSQRITMRQLREHEWVCRGFEESIPLHMPDRPPLNEVDARIVEFLVEEFRIQFSRDEIIRAMEGAISTEWQAWRTHPIINLYYLAREKMSCSTCTPRLTGYLSASSSMASSSRSLVSTPATVSPPPLHRQRSLSVCLPPSTLDDDDEFEAVPLYGVTQHRPRAQSEQVPEMPNRVTLRERSRSMASTPIVEGLPSPIPSLRVRTVWLRGLFTVNTTSSRSPCAIRQELIRALRACAIPFIDNQSYFICEHVPSYRMVGEEAARNNINQDAGGMLTPPPSPTRAMAVEPVILEIHIVKVAIVGLYGIQFKKIKGDFVIYKRVCSLIMDEAKL